MLLEREFFISINDKYDNEICLKSFYSKQGANEFLRNYNKNHHSNYAKIIGYEDKEINHYLWLVIMSIICLIFYILGVSSATGISFLQ